MVNERRADYTRGMQTSDFGGFPVEDIYGEPEGQPEQESKEEPLVDRDSGADNPFVCKQCRSRITLAMERCPQCNIVLKV